jgi:hypothetical protein
MAEDPVTKPRGFFRHVIVVAILLFPYSLLLGLIPIFEHCASKESTR